MKPLKQILTLGMILLLGLTACATLPAAPQEVTSTAPPAEATATAVPVTETPTPSTANPVAALAMQALAAQTGLSADSITVQTIESVEWTNGCLEINYEGTACTDVIVPGYRIILQAEGQSYEYRANQDGSLLLLAEPILTTPDTKVEEIAREALATQLGLPKTAITLVSLEAVDWPDGCLGITFSDMACITVITPGYRIILEANGQTYEYHSNKDGSQMLLATQLPNTEEVPALQVDIQGGIAGFCDHVNLYLSGLATYQSCNASQETRYQLTAPQIETLQALINQYKAFEFTQADPAVADQMTVQFIFNGQGTQDPGEDLYLQLQTLGMEVINLARGLTPDS
jgi:hypothetical protein